jgi:HlyD family secretion protein
VNRFKFVILLLILFGGALGYYFFSTDRSNELVLIGTVDANQVIVSSKILGRIDKLTVDEGSAVKAGDLIATIDSGELLAQKNAAGATLASLRSQVAGSEHSQLSTAGETSSAVTNASARLQSARASLLEAQADLERQKGDTDRTIGLAKQGIASAQDRDRAAAALRAAEARVNALSEQVAAAQAEVSTAQARVHQAAVATSAVATARAQMQSAQAELAQAETRLGYTQVVSPISGMVSVRAARQGEVVNPGTPIVTVVDLGDTWVYASIPETYQENVQIGDQLTVRMPGGSNVPGKVIAKSAEGDFATQRDVSRTKRDIKTVRLKLHIDNPGMKFVPGITAEVLVPKSRLGTR